MTDAGSTPPNALARSERTALADLMLAVGPEAPTLCSGWTTRDLAAHLVIRQSRPDAAIGILASPLAGWTEHVQSRAAARDWNSLVASVRQGPPRWSIVSLAALDAETNTIEYYVHHEDVRRAGEVWEPRILDEATNADLWSRVLRSGRLLLRRSPVGVLAAPTDGPAASTEVRIKDGDRSVTLAGPVGEIVLALYGRVTQGLEVRGPVSDVEAFTAFPR